MSSEFNRFFKSNSLASTYKPTLAKCLLDIGDYQKDEGSEWVTKNDDTFTVNLHFIAARFLRYYYPLKFQFKLKQEGTKQTVAVYKILDNCKDLFNQLKSKKTPSKKQMCMKLFDEMRETTFRHSLMRNMVLPKLLNDCNIYKNTDDKQHITIKKDVVEFMRKNKNTLESALNHMIARYLETCNASPNISTKLEESMTRKYLSPNPKREVLEIADNTCFYCPAKNVKFAMDHFVPWNYLGQTAQYNMVPACTPCNSSKNDKLTDPKYLDCLIDRNKKLKKLPMGYSEEFLKNMYENAIVEYHGKEKKLWTSKNTTK